MKKLLFLLALALGITRAYCAQVPDTTQQELIQDFSGGLNTTDPSHKLKKGFSPYMRNVIIDNGKISRINGYVTLGSSRTLFRVTGIFPFVRESGQTTFLVTDSSLTLETGDFKTWTFVSSGSNSGSLLTWMQVRNKMWGSNGIDPVMTYDGTTKVILNGSGTTPNVPRFRLGAYYQDRVWGLAIPNGASDLYWSTTITTDSVIISPDDSRAWIDPRNATYIGRGDGQVATALWIYQGLLRAGKEQSIYTIYGDNPSNYLPRKEEANIGVSSNESVRILDGQTHYLGRVGIYRNVQRISDLIDPDIAAMNNGPSSILGNLWESQSDFNRGQYSGSTATAAGLLQLNTVAITTTPAGTGTFFLGAGVFTPPPGSQTLDPAGTTFYGPVKVQFSSAVISDYYRFYTKSVNFGLSSNASCSGSPKIKVIVGNIYTGETHDRTFDLLPGGQNLDVQFSSQAPVFEGWQANSSSFTMKWEYASKDLCSGTIVLFNVGQGTVTYSFLSATTGQFLSEVSTLTSVTAWGNFDSANNTNGGLINYFIHTSTSLVNLSTKTWVSINPGVIISEPLINNYIQWCATMTSLAAIDNVTISHIEGQATDARAFAMDWQNRYWLTVTTGTDGTKRLTYIKSKITNATPDAWMPADAYPIDCYAKANNVLYGGSASTGSVYRLDYGTNLDGLPIMSVYDTPDLALGDYFFNKNILKYLVDGVKSVGGTMTILTFANSSLVTTSTFTITGSGRYSHIVEGVTRTVKTLRLRLQNGQTDIGLGINNVNILYEATKALSNQ